MSNTKIIACNASKRRNVVIRPILSETAPQKNLPKPLNIELTAMSVAPAAYNDSITVMSAKLVDDGMRSFSISCNRGD